MRSKLCQTDTRNHCQIVRPRVSLFPLTVQHPPPSTTHLSAAPLSSHICSSHPSPYLPFPHLALLPPSLRYCSLQYNPLCHIFPSIGPPFITPPFITPPFIIPPSSTPPSITLLSIPIFCDSLLTRLFPWTAGDLANPLTHKRETRLRRMLREAPLPSPPCPPQLGCSPSRDAGAQVRWESSSQLTCRPGVDPIAATVEPTQGAAVGEHRAEATPEQTREARSHRPRSRSLDESLDALLQLPRLADGDLALLDQLLSSEESADGNPSSPPLSRSSPSAPCPVRRRDRVRSVSWASGVDLSRQRKARLTRKEKPRPRLQRKLRWVRSEEGWPLCDAARNEEADGERAVAYGERTGSPSNSKGEEGGVGKPPEEALCCDLKMSQDQTQRDCLVQPHLQSEASLASTLPRWARGGSFWLERGCLASREGEGAGFRIDLDPALQPASDCTEADSDPTSSLEGLHQPRIIHNSGSDSGSDDGRSSTGRWANHVMPRGSSHAIKDEIAELSGVFGGLMGTAAGPEDIEGVQAALPASQLAVRRMQEELVSAKAELREQRVCSLLLSPQRAMVISPLLHHSTTHLHTHSLQHSSLAHSFTTALFTCTFLHCRAPQFHSPSLPHSSLALCFIAALLTSALSPPHSSLAHSLTPPLSFTSTHSVAPLYCFSPAHSLAPPLSSF